MMFGESEEERAWVLVYGACDMERQAMVRATREAVPESEGRLCWRRMPPPRMGWELVRTRQPLESYEGDALEDIDAVIGGVWVDVSIDDLKEKTVDMTVTSAVYGEGEVSDEHAE